ncbi:hypothetical protein HHI36_001053 [Cryptolaemus montrouzieri]|uniref:Pyrroline-5-carboxylate reductase n=1 Tax=Cryptolaemus montrouzieri TaxID=559131 RepID=A0ABD2P694_9CUCU
MTEGITKIFEKIGFIGGGNMARAIFDGIVDAGLVETKQIYVSGPRLENLEFFKQKGASIITSNGAVVDYCDVIFICVKPQILHEVVRQIIDQSKEQWDKKIFVSVLAGTSILKIENLFMKPIKLVRVMPNTAVLVRKGCCSFSANAHVTDEEVLLIKTLLESSGLCLEVPEGQIDAIGALSGSGPAFMYLIIESLADGGVKMGIPRAMAIKLAAQTMLGAATMVLQSGKHSAQLKDEVCSAGGTTITGIHALEKGGVRTAIIDAVEAATKRSIELTKLP